MDNVFNFFDYNFFQALYVLASKNFVSYNYQFNVSINQISFRLDDLDDNSRVIQVMKVIKYFQLGL